MQTATRINTVLKLRTRNRYSGKTASHPVYYLQHDNRYVVVACNETDSYKPDWYLNLKEEPLVEIELDGRRFFARADTPVGSERLDIWPLVTALSAEIERELPRNVTGVVLTPII